MYNGRNVSQRVAARMQKPTPSPQYDVFISHGEAEAPHAASLRADLALARFRVCPHSVFSPGALAACRVVLALQSRHKPADPVRAALGAAQAAEQPLVVAYVGEAGLALQQRGRDALYEPYATGLVRLVHLLWAALGDGRGALFLEKLPADEGTARDWLAAQGPPTPQA